MSSSSVLHVAASAATDAGTMAEGIKAVTSASDSAIETTQKMTPALFT